ncbi:uncharacterized protein YbcI [Staphylococcus auricularis]|uniref:DUF2294 domain-containing protein n=1 Tax=Staphylococcus auricularis TaxID=29379 RepID=A0AAP8TSM7_9STAP|nr:DUF2294 domain-containing protein [Staphylococcus auricularis]MBM0868732.1 DUF2294 domain-containing protein [Staphylococcus auricularis]MCE5037599.1 DUF2294 domain-containing protein [Staphylococcus auricularis]MCG7342333.1 DUF2294 domain-containing protein [Staphylococcus auricularis]MDC6326235.1 DUF2294 domain-containing protein [Staphylococcus auricularis]MDN4533874.1 DUF2294 domain-containing protein [Staphylococcus auricularis]
MHQTKGSCEAEISKAITKWEKEYLGRGSISVKTDILRDMIIVDLQGILTAAEYAVSQTQEGLLSIKRTRSTLVESGVSQLYEMIAEITGTTVKSFHTDISSRTGERLIVFKLNENIENQFETAHNKA